MLKYFFIKYFIYFEFLDLQEIHIEKPLVIVHVTFLFYYFDRYIFVDDNNFKRDSIETAQSSPDTPSKILLKNRYLLFII